MCKSEKSSLVNRVLCILLSVSLAATLLPASAFAAAGETAGDSTSSTQQMQAVSGDFANVTQKDQPASCGSASESANADANAADAITPGTNAPDIDAGAPGANAPAADVNASDPNAPDPSQNASQPNSDSALTYSPMAGFLTAQLDYSNAPTLANGGLPCGVPVKFTLCANGGSGSCKYLFGSLHLLVDGTMQSVYDDTWSLTMTTDNTFEYTFRVSGTYYLYWTVYDASSLGNTAHVYRQIVVNDPAYPSVEQHAQKVADECSSKGFAMDYEKALFYNDYIVDNTECDHTIKEAGAIGVFVKNSDGSNGSATFAGASAKVDDAGLDLSQNSLNWQSDVWRSSR